MSVPPRRLWGNKLQDIPEPVLHSELPQLMAYLTGQSVSHLNPPVALGRLGLAAEWNCETTVCMCFWRSRTGCCASLDLPTMCDLASVC